MCLRREANAEFRHANCSLQWRGCARGHCCASIHAGTHQAKEIVGADTVPGFGCTSYILP